MNYKKADQAKGISNPMKTLRALRAWERAGRDLTEARLVIVSKRVRLERVMLDIQKLERDLRQ